MKKIILSIIFLSLWSNLIGKEFFYTSGYLVKGLIPYLEMSKNNKKLDKNDLKILNMGISMGYINAYYDISDMKYNSSMNFDVICLKQIKNRDTVYKHIVDYYIPNYKSFSKMHSIIYLNEAMKSYKYRC